MSLLWVKHAGLSRSAEHVYGTNDINSLFPTGNSVRPIPWEQQARLKDRHDYDANLVQHAIRHPEQHMDSVDPRNLHGSQPSITRQGLHYYMHEPTWRETGHTFKDNDQLMNRHPVVYTREPNPRNPRNGPEHVLLSGHHRAAAALLRGEPLQAIHVHGPWGERR